MKVAMINDCAFVGETLLKFMPSEVEWQHVKRSRNLWSKTFGVAYNIARAKADVYHVHYLLQDCYVASRFGKKPIVGHAHGSDLRKGLKHPIWRRIVMHNLTHCSKILVSTPDIIAIAQQVRKDTEYLPNPIDTTLFYPKPPHVDREKTKILIASDSNWNVKGTDIAIRALDRIKDRVDVSIIRHGTDFDRTLRLASSFGLKMSVLPKVSHESLNEYYWDADAIIDRFTLGSLGMVSLEAIACGRPAIACVSSEFNEHRDFPLKDLRKEDEIANLLQSQSLPQLWKNEYDFLKKNHDPVAVASRVFSIYEDLAKH